MLENAYVAGNPRWNGSDRMVVVSGCSGGGKSALLAEMAARGYTIFPEPGRQVVKEEVLIDGDALPWKDARRFSENCIARAAYFFNVADPSAGPVLFDRSIIDAVTAIRGLGGGPVPFAEAARRYRYARRVFLAPPWRELFEADAERRHSFAAAEAEYRALSRSYPEYGYETVELPRLDVHARADFLASQLAGA